MPVVAMCPYCRVGGVKAPERAVGWTASCPNCYSNFTIVPNTDPLPSTKPKPEPKPAPAPSSVEDTRAHAAAVDATEPSAVAVAVPPPPVRVAVPAPVAVPFPAPAGEPGFAVALVAVTLFGVGLLATVFPFGRYIGLGLTGIGTLVGLACLFATGRTQLVGAAAALLNLVGVVLLLLAPTWFGLEPWWHEADPNAPTGPMAVGHDGHTLALAEWVDPTRSSWAHRDVRVTVRSAGIGPLELTAPNGLKKMSKELYLQVAVRVANSGVERRIELGGWASGSTAPPEQLPKLTDAAGKPLRVKAVDGGWEAADRPKAGSLLPGRAADILFLYEPPAVPPGPPGTKDAGPKVESLRFELPGAALGIAETARFQIPGSFLSYRPVSRGGVP